LGRCVVIVAEEVDPDVEEIVRSGFGETGRAPETAVGQAGVIV
jgi:hypothetical protein